MRAAELAEVIDIPTAPETRPRKRRAQPAEVIPIDTARAWVQGNWKRRAGVATRYELAQAIERLLARGDLELDGEGRLRLMRRHRGEPLTREQRWAREDEELRAYCEQMEVHETRSKRARESTEMQGSTFEASVYGSTPRKGVDRYVLRELRHAGATPYEEVVTAIFEKGGLEWVLEPLRRVKARRKR